MITIRAATRKDRPAILAIAKQEAARYPTLRVDVEKMHNAVTVAIDDQAHFARVVEDEGQVKGVILCFTSENLWAQRKNSNIALWYSEIPGTGAALLREFKTWIKEKRAVKIAGMAPDLDLDPRIGQLASRIGFAKHGGSYLFFN